MDKLSDFIPLVIIVASIIASIVGGKKKKEISQRTALPGKTPESPQPVLTRTLEEKRVQHQALSYRKPERKQEVDRNRPSRFKPKIASNQTDDNQDIEVERENFSFDISNTNEVAKAIIYAEIFNKKVL
jgi:hypothetical protein